VTERQASYETTTTANVSARIISSDDDREFYLRLREALLAMVDAVERRINTSPRTAELRRQAKQG
jgi:hypothetical protein